MRFAAGSGATTNYLVDTNNHTGYAQVVEELQNNAVVKSFTHGHDLISQRIIDGPLSFYNYDGHGSVRQLTDASASVTDIYDYDAFGIAESINSNAQSIISAMTASNQN